MDHSLAEHYQNGNVESNRQPLFITSGGLYPFGRSAENIGMDINEIRRNNLRSLAEANDGITALADRLNKSQSQLSQLIGRSPSKNIGSKIAREIENVFDLKAGWMDLPHNTEHLTAPAKADPALIEYNEKTMLAAYIKVDEILDKAGITASRKARGIATLSVYSRLMKGEDINTDELITNLRLNDL